MGDVESTPSSAGAMGGLLAVAAAREEERDGGLRASDDWSAVVVLEVRAAPRGSLLVAMRSAMLNLA